MFDIHCIHRLVTHNSYVLLFMFPISALETVKQDAIAQFKRSKSQCRR